MGDWLININELAPGEQVGSTTLNMVVLLCHLAWLFPSMPTGKKRERRKSSLYLLWEARRTGETETFHGWDFCFYYYYYY